MGVNIEFARRVNVQPARSHFAKCFELLAPRLYNIFTLTVTLVRLHLH